MVNRRITEHMARTIVFTAKVQGSTEGGFLPSAEAEAEGAKKLRPSAEDRSRSRRFQT